MRYTIWGVALVLGLLTGGAPSSAHHSIGAQFDFDKPVEFTGVLKQAEWVNPHSLLHLEVTDANGAKSVWIFETIARATAAGRSLARASEGGLAVGQTYTFRGYAARNGNTLAFLKDIKMPDGRLITMWFGNPNG
jgi:hypothetical protein